ncbi:MAG: tetratricopeptide repeat protein [Candidatus Lokiarchaeota archaeon]|nr:tetratricopeptide repeat protein [Candidatus Lokiarchaeota archaeon]
MKPSILKKLNLIIEDANTLKDKNEFQKAIDKFEQALNFINIKVDELSEKKTEIENIKNAINQTYSVEINSIVQDSIRLTALKEYEKAKTNFKKGIRIAKEKITDKDLQEAEINELDEFINEIEIEQLIIKGIKIRDEDKNLNDAIKVFEDGLVLTEKIRDPEGKKDHISNIKKEISKTNSSQFNQILKQGTELKESGQFQEAIKVFEKAKSYFEQSLSPDAMKTEILNIINMSNEIYSIQIKSIVEKGKDLIGKGLNEEAISELRNSLIIAEKMYDSDLKKLEISLIAESLNPIYIERIKPILEEGNEVTQRDNFSESVTAIKEAVAIYNRAYTIADSMVDSERKILENKKISDLINQACLPGISIIKDKSIQLIGNQKYEEAINEIYVALSVAREMAYPEDENIILADLKNLMNKVYSTQNKEVINHGKELVNQNEYEKALEVFIEALNNTNKMYLTEEMEKDVNLIKSLIYDTEVKQLVGKGKLDEQQKEKEKEIEKLQKRLEYAQSIEDPKRRVEEMNNIKNLIDEVHSDEIKFLIEQGNQLAEKEAFGEAFSFYERALKVNEMMEEPDVKNKDLVKESYKRELINKAGLEIKNKNYDTAIENGKKAIELDKKFVDAYYHIGLAYNYKKKYDAAIESFQKALDYNKNHIESWNLIGLAYMAKNEFDNALTFLNKALKIDPNFSTGWFNIGNIYKLTNEFDKAIESYGKATKLDPDFAKAWFFMGCTNFDKKDYHRAIDHLEKAIKIDPNLAQDVNPLIKELKIILDKLNESLSMAFINR